MSAIFKLPEAYADEFCDDMDDGSRAALIALFAQCQHDAIEACRAVAQRHADVNNATYPEANAARHEAESIAESIEDLKRKPS